MVVVSTPIPAGGARAGSVLHSLIAAARARQRRRRVLVWTVLMVLIVGGGVPFAVWYPSTTPNSTSSSASPLASQPPFIGVACHSANSTRCGRIGMLVWLRSPGDSVSATLNGMPVTLLAAAYGPGQVVTYVGYARFAPAALQLPTLWSGSPARSVVLRVVARHGVAVQRQTLRVMLHPVWG